METIYSKLKLETSYNCSKWCSATTYQKVNSSIIVSTGVMNDFNERFPLAKMFPLAVMHKGTDGVTFLSILIQTASTNKKL